MVTQKTLNALPDIATLRKLTQSLAMLDAIIGHEWDDRYSSFNSQWTAGDMMASMRNGGGDEYFILFNADGAILKGFDHESSMNICDSDEMVWAGVIDAVPEGFQPFLSEPAFPIEYTTFCLWRQSDDAAWQVGNIAYPENDADADGSDWLLFLLDGNPVTYRDWAQDYYEQEVDLAAVEHIYQYLPLTKAVVAALAPDITWEELADDIAEIGYPAANSMT